MTSVGPRRPPLWLQEAFDNAKNEFLRDLKDPASAHLTKITTIDDVYREAEQIQRTQAKSKTLRGLGRINKCLDLLRQYSDVIEIFVQVKPDILALIWGPIKMILKMSSHAVGAFEKFVQVLVDLGDSLPQFDRFMGMFQQNEQLLKILVLFYKDTLQIYHLTFNFFKTKWGLIRESLWPRFSAKLNIICANINNHKDLFRSQVTLEEINRAFEARKKDEQERERARIEQDRQNFRDMRIELAPRFYDDDLEHFLGNSLPGSGKWVQDDPIFKEWLRGDSSNRVSWFRGIPGAGKTRLCANVVHHLREEGHNVAFAFLRHDTTAQNHPIRVLQSLIFQLLLEDESLQPVLHEQYTTNYRKLTGSVEFLQSILSNLVDNSGSVYIIVDGLDEVRSEESTILVKSLLGAVETTPHLKTLFSSRYERSISNMLKGKASAIRVHLHNAADIACYVEAETKSWLDNLRKRTKDQSAVSELELSIRKIVERSQGMFLYARLVLEIVMKQDTVAKARQETKSLPKGLEEVYCRILQKFGEENSESDAIRTILSWVGCAVTPLTVREILQILAIQPGRQGFTGEPMVFRDVEETCSPILEVRDGFVYFVHFTAKEFFFGEQSETFVNAVDAHIQALQTCISYLSFDCFDRFTTSTITATLDGNFVLFQYACYNWLEHIRQCSKQTTYRQKQVISHRVGIFKSIVTDRDWMGEPQQSFKLEFKPWYRTGKVADIGDFLATWSQFIGKVKMGMVDHSCNESISDEDPTILLQTFLAFRQTLETLLCKGSRHDSECSCAYLIEIYGANLFYCNRYYCKYFRVGFVTQRERDVHLKSHERPFKCEDLACIFADLGFKTEEDQTRHAAAMHNPEDDSPNAASSGDMWANFSQKELESLAFDAVRAGETDLMKTLLPHFERTPDELVTFAGQYASLTMIQCIVDAYTKHQASGLHNPHFYLDIETPKERRRERNYGVALTGAITSKDLTKIKKLLDLGASKSLEPTQIAAVLTFDFELLDFLLNCGVEFKDAIYHRDCIQALLLMDQADAIKIIERLYQYVRNDVTQYEVGFHISARYGFLAGLKWFRNNLALQSWVNTNEDGWVLRRDLSNFLDEEWVPNAVNTDIVGTAIYAAASNAHGGNVLPGESRKACIARYAESVKYLLRQGADPTISLNMMSSTPDLEETPGVKNLEKHFDMSWQRIVDRYTPRQRYDSELESDSVENEAYHEERKRRRKSRDRPAKKRRR
ncbi:hypothetical protein F4677DRAFT_394594 [Hypoxylon crocopeplum]|nr:hypothetical protein F4677DRAFT_394594 [Hypoxylon crocopeplum]